MSHFLESIAFQNGEFQLLDLHQARVDRTFATFYPETSALNLSQILVPISSVGLYKFRVLYDDKEVKVSYQEYVPKKINSIKLVETSIDYSFKFSNRSELNQLLSESDADEIIMIKDGLITDSSYSNLAFYDGEKWWTPRFSLLAGVRRAYLLESRAIEMRDISVTELASFEKVCLINAMMDLGETTFPIGRIS